MSAGKRVTVTASATVIHAADPYHCERVLIRNKGSVAISLGDASVTFAAGFELAAGESAEIELGPNEDLYGIADTGQTAVQHALVTRG